ncbi:transmembrane protein 222a [Nerophis lumbriciformis]|uniref:transmembrane protein 222a n=1 Tax=Nerophis lumbriciformis TaxID=546530 RepID=UPI003BAB1CC5
MAQTDDIDIMMNYHGDVFKNDRKNCRYPYCVVWTPIPILSWVLPFIGHMGICTSSGVIRDFAGSYFVSEDSMGFGRPTKYWKLDVDKVCDNSAITWDKAVHDASEEYKCRPHNLCLDNCHSHVAMALNLMRYDNSTSWNMVNLCVLSLIHGKYVSWPAILKTWLPFIMLCGVFAIFCATRTPINSRDPFIPRVQQMRKGLLLGRFLPLLQRS